MTEPVVQALLCTACGYCNLAHASFCTSCGNPLKGCDEKSLARPDAQPLPDPPGLLLARDLSAEALDQLRAAVAEVEDRGFQGFVGRVLWPEGNGKDLRQELPPGMFPLTKILSDPDARAHSAWKLDLIEALGRSIDSLKATGGRLTSLGFEQVIVEHSGLALAGLAVPICLTRSADLPDGRPTQGIDCRFAAPEVQGFVDHPVGSAADVFLLGILSYYLLTGTPPNDLGVWGFCPPLDTAPLGPATRAVFEEAFTCDPACRQATATRFADELRRAIVRDAARADVQLCFVGCSDIGLGGRDQNEDSWAGWVCQRGDGSPAQVLGGFTVADGMGGSAHGERASALAVDRFVEELLCDLPHLAGGLLQPSELAEVARDWLRALNEAVLDLGGRLGAPNDVGTTLSGLVFIGSRALLVHVGDSRVYLLRDGTLCQLTRDQTQAEALRETDQNLGEDDLQERYGNVLTSHLGTSGCSPLTELLDVKSGDRFLLCTDGLVAGIDDEDLTEALLELPLERAATSLIRRSKRNLMRQCSSGKAGHSSDNITAVVVDVAIRVK